MNVKGYEFERLVLQDLDGRTCGVCIAKKTWVIKDDRHLKEADDPEPIRFAAVMEDGKDAGEAPPLYEADTAVFKPKADFVVLGTAVAPQKVATQRFSCTVKLGGFQRSLVITGKRYAKFKKPKKDTKDEFIGSPPEFSEPERVVRVKLSFRNAYGGVAKYKPRGGDEVIEIPCPCNPFGKGYCVQNSPEAIDGLELPQIEDPERLLTPENLVQEIGVFETLPLPAGFGFYGGSWYPRIAYAGVMPFEVERMKVQVRQYAASLDAEKDKDVVTMLETFDPPVMRYEYYQACAPGMSVEYPKGNETVVLENIGEQGYLAFDLPGLRPLLEVDAGRGKEVVPLELDTLCVNADDMKVYMVFRGRVFLMSDDDVEAFLKDVPKVEDLSYPEYMRMVLESPRRS